MSSDNEIILTPEQISACGILDPAQANRNLASLQKLLGRYGFPSLLSSFIHSLSRAADPDMGLNNFERFVGALGDASAFLSLCRSRPALLPALMTILGASRFLSAYLITTADENLLRLADPDYLAHPPGKEALAARLAGAVQAARDEAGFLRALRLFRKQEMLRIALRDLLGKGDLAGIVGELSDLAEAALQTAYERVYAELETRFGRPMITAESGAVSPAGFAVIAMGKLGGRELNFSSDIDLMYVYTADGETEGVRTPEGGVSNRTTNHEFFIKLAEKLSAAIGRTTEEGFVFRVDLRLRPEGQRGPLAQSLGGYEIYYESWGQTWERAALVKARPVAGDEATGREFLDRVTPFVYRKYLDYGAIVEIREMKQKINREVQQKGRERRDVKLGYGGIREIEFLIQSLQLIYGGRDRTLRERSSLKALHTLSQKGLLTYQEAAELTKAYVFLRAVEHRIQMLNDLQTQELPSDRQDLRALARRAGYLDPGREADALLYDYGEHTRRVRSMYDNLLGQAGAEEGQQAPDTPYGVFLDPETREQDSLMVLAQYGFRDPSKAYRNLLLLREGAAFMHQTPRSRRLFNETFPRLFEDIIASPDPDMALNHLESYCAVQGSWDAFQSFAKQDPAYTKILIAVFANSEYFSRMLIRSPHLLGDLLDTSRAFRLGTAALMRKGLAAAMEKAEDAPAKLDALRRFKHREEIRIGMADLLGDMPSHAASRSLSRLAEACLGGALALAAVEAGKGRAAQGPLKGLAIIGAGKLGGRELTYGSDLDILFVFSGEHAGQPPPGMSAFEYFSRTAEKTIACLTAMTREGFAYRVDTRLRPTGSKGPLVQSIDAFRSYYSSQAETWERQALVNSRFVAGDREVGNAFTDAISDLIYREADRPALADDIRSMRKRMEDELGREDRTRYNLKQGPGGLVDVEFLAQFLQLLHGKERTRLRTPGSYNALRALRKENLLTPGDYGILKQAYLFYRMIEGRMRIVANQATHELSRDPVKLRPLARRAGYQDEDGGAGEKLLADYERMRTTVREVFERVVKG
jgi:glutamate-ammonia-ligase adenylyltransferase